MLIFFFLHGVALIMIRTKHNNNLLGVVIVVLQLELKFYLGN